MHPRWCYSLDTETNFHSFFAGATNRPQELDDAVIRRMVKRVYIPLPCFAARHKIIVNLLLRQKTHSLTDGYINTIANRTEGIYNNLFLNNLFSITININMC